MLPCYRYTNQLEAEHSPSLIGKKTKEVRKRSMEEALTGELKEKKKTQGRVPTNPSGDLNGRIRVSVIDRVASVSRWSVVVRCCRSLWSSVRVVCDSSC